MKYLFLLTFLSIFSDKPVAVFSSSGAYVLYDDPRFNNPSNDESLNSHKKILMENFPEMKNLPEGFSDSAFNVILIGKIVESDSFLYYIALRDDGRAFYFEASCLQRAPSDYCLILNTKTTKIKEFYSTLCKFNYEKLEDLTRQIVEYTDDQFLILIPEGATNGLLKRGDGWFLRYRQNGQNKQSEPCWIEITDLLAKMRKANKSFENVYFWGAVETFCFLTKSQDDGVYAASIDDESDDENDDENQ